jgi:hypothetical protein
MGGRINVLRYHFMTGLTIWIPSPSTIWSRDLIWIPMVWRVVLFMLLFNEREKDAKDEMVEAKGSGRCVSCPVTLIIVRAMLHHKASWPGLGPDRSGLLGDYFLCVYCYEK